MLLFFTDFISDPDIKDIAGMIIIGIILFNFLANMGFMFVGMMVRVKYLVMEKLVKAIKSMCNRDKNKVKI